MRRVVMLVVLLTACATGEGSPGGPELLDVDGDGRADAVDLDGQDVIFLEAGETPLGCNAQLVDTNADGAPEGLDVDCDDAIDVSF